MWPPDEQLEPTQRHGGDPAEVRALLGGLLSPQALSGSMLFVAAHPEDPVRGASWLLRRGPGTHVVHVTDERASLEALWLAGLPQERLLPLGSPQQGASQELVELTECLLAILKALRPSLLVVHPYAGRHPDHDAAAFIAHAAVALLVRGGRTPPTLLEMMDTACGHLGSQPPGFPPATGCPGVTAPLTGPERALKQRMLACYESRGRDAHGVTNLAEAYRVAPHYDFTRPPREGLLGYGTPTPRMTAVHWRRLAREALETLKLGDASTH